MARIALFTVGGDKSIRFSASCEVALFSVPPTDGEHGLAQGVLDLRQSLQPTFSVAKPAAPQYSTDVTHLLNVHRVPEL